MILSGKAEQSYGGLSEVIKRESGTVNESGANHFGSKKTVTMASQLVGRTGAFLYFNHTIADGLCMLSFELALTVLSPKEKVHSMCTFPFFSIVCLQGILMGRNLNLSA